MLPRSILLGLFLGLASSGPAPALDGSVSCPDVRATQIDARVDHQGETRRCGIGLRLFGIGGSLFGPRCPEKTFTYPSHQECRGERSPGTRCEPRGTLPVSAKECECVRATVLGTGLLLPSCSCQATNDGGEVEDASTMACPPEVVGEPFPRGRTGS